MLSFFSLAEDEVSYFREWFNRSLRILSQSQLFVSIIQTLESSDSCYHILPQLKCKMFSEIWQDNVLKSIQAQCKEQSC
jgi:hypothetical protein